MSGPTHFKRYRMERSLTGLSELGAFPEGFAAIAWSDRLLHLHADVKYDCFRDELDGRLFPNLGDRFGCRFLMESIRVRKGFCPEATWLLAGPDGYCGTVQGVFESRRTGAIQNLGIASAYRGRGLGRALLEQALCGFARAGARCGALEVTADNGAALELYRRIGFRATRAFYRPLPRAGQPVGI